MTVPKVRCPIRPMGFIVFGIFATLGGCATGWKELRLALWGTSATGKVSARPRNGRGAIGGR